MTDFDVPGKLTGAKQVIRTVDTELGPRHFTDINFSWNGEHYGCRFPGAFSPNEFEASKESFIRRRRKEECA